MNISFQPLTSDHFPLLRKWLKEPHVAEFWQEPEVKLPKPPFGK